MRKLRTKKAETEGSDHATTEQPGVGEAFDRETVAKLAYEFWLNRGCPTGSAAEDWFQAEQALQAAQPNTGDAEDRIKAARRARQGAAMRAGG
jgi:hypothetical protein